MRGVSFRLKGTWRVVFLLIVTVGLLWYVVNSEQSAGELVAPASAVSTVSDFLTQSATSPESRDSC